MSIKLSLICPMYKVVEYLPDLIDSLVAGVNSEEVEVIFVDDCCPQGSMDFCQNYIKELGPSVKFRPIFIQQEINGGLGSSRNLGLSVVSSDYVGFIDSDDAVSPEYWSFLSDKIYAAKADIIEFGYEEFLHSLPEVQSNTSEKLSATSLTPYKTGFFVWTRVYKRELLTSLPFLPGSYEDVNFVSHAYVRASVIERYTNKLLFYRKRDGSITAERKADYSMLFLNLISAVEATLPLSKDKKNLVKALSKKCFIVLLKGGRISNGEQRRQFFTRSKQGLQQLNAICEKHSNSLSLRVFNVMSSVICKVGTHL